ncbi:MAG: asparagine synthase (glutamine-hydrolyzing) [Thermoanaerobaculia bacterium]
MCGICGVVGGDRWREVRQVETMTRALAHRGPDDHGIQTCDRAVLGNRRLAILDPSPAGHQPLGIPNARVWITHNGEIYNYRELRRELEEDGHRFESGTDTEVILALYLRHGTALLNRLRGMFAFAIWDGTRGRLLAARDPFGQKPFYFTVTDGKLLFASEIKALLAHADVRVEPEPAAVSYYLSLRLIPPPLTMFRGIRKLAAGHWLIWDGGPEPVIGRYWKPRVGAFPERSDGEWIEGLLPRIERAVDAHRVSDVPVGAFLSGGLDSSVVVAALARQGADPLQTFAVGSDVPAFDERPYARAMARQCHTLHREVVASASLLGRIPGLVAALDEPSDPIAACFYEAARLAGSHVKVVLGGDGGDEIFGGFDRYAAFDRADQYAQLPRWLREEVIRPIVRLAPESFGYKALTQRARWLDSVSSERGGRMYARMTSHTRFTPELSRTLYGAELSASLAGHDALAAIVAPFEELSGADSLDRMIYADLMTRLPEHTLMLADHLGMAHGLEVRSPLLDVELAEYCLSMPRRLRVRNGLTKVALRRAAEPWLPPALLRRRKQGFMFPVARWLEERALAEVRDRLLHGPLVREGWIRRQAIEALVDEHARRRADHHVRIWQLASLDAWHRLYLGGVAAEVQEEELRAAGSPVPQGLPEAVLGATR